MPASDPKTDPTSGTTPRSEGTPGPKTDPARSTPDASASASDPSTQDPVASGSADSSAATKDSSAATKGKGGAKAKDEKKVETVACPSCANTEQGKPAELVPYPDDGPNEFKKGTAFCEKEGKRVRVDKTPDEDAALASAPTV